MAEFIPTLDLIRKDRMEKHTEGELALLEALRALPDDYCIYFQPHINFAHPDIVVMNKTGGVLIIEVKDWNLNGYQYHPDETMTMDYLTRGNEPGRIRSPFTQAKEYKDEFYSILRPPIISERVKLGTEEKDLYGIVRTSVFFYCASQSDIAGLYGSDNLGTNNGCKTFRRYYYYWCREDLQSFADSVRRLIGWPIPLFSDPIRNEVKKILTLSEEWMEQTKPFDPKDLNSVQRELVKPNPGGKVRVKGAAGSGKTTVIAFKAVNCYREYGSPVLILTYNITLRNYICDAIARQTREMSQWERSRAFEVIHYDAFIPQVFRRIGVDGPHPSDYEDLTCETNWDQYHRDADDLLRNKVELIKKQGCQYRTVLIDEAQDYERNWFVLIQDCFLQPDADCMIVADQKQNIYQRNNFQDKLPPVPGFSGRWRELKSSYRLSYEVSLLCRDFLNENMMEYGDDDIPEIETDREGTVEYFEMEGRQGRLPGKEIWKIIDAFAPGGKIISRNDMCVLFGETSQLRDFEYEIRKCTNNGVKFQMMCETKEEYDQISLLSAGNEKQKNRDLHDIRYARKRGFRMNPGTIKLSTIHSFKGWEISTVFIVLDGNSNIRKEHIYTALTRARNNIVIIDLGGNDFGPHLRKYVNIRKKTVRLAIPVGYEFSDKPTKMLFTAKHGICTIERKLPKEGLLIKDQQGNEISLDFDYYLSKNQACYVKRITNAGNKNN